MYSLPDGVIACAGRDLETELMGMPGTPAPPTCKTKGWGVPSLHLVCMTRVRDPGTYPTICSSKEHTGSVRL